MKIFSFNPELPLQGWLIHGVLFALCQLSRFELKKKEQDKTLEASFPPFLTYKAHIDVALCKSCVVFVSPVLLADQNPHIQALLDHSPWLGLSSHPLMFS